MGDAMAAIRTISGLTFAVHSPSLYTYEAPSGTICLEYCGRGLWAIRILSRDSGTVHYYESLHAIELALDRRHKESA